MLRKIPIFPNKFVFINFNDLHQYWLVLSGHKGAVNNKNNNDFK